MSLPRETAATGVALDSGAAAVTGASVSLSRVSGTCLTVEDIIWSGGGEFCVITAAGAIVDSGLAAGMVFAPGLCDVAAAVTVVFELWCADEEGFALP
jgi:hypothetical protein